MRRVLFFVILFLARKMSHGSDDLEGTKAGEAKELIPEIRFRWCPRGSFVMGSPKGEQGRNFDEEQVRVEISQGFWLGESEITQSQWARVMATSPWKDKRYVKEGDDYPASYISHIGATSYCVKLTAQERQARRLDQGWRYSLPTEAQWEYACRAGTTTTYSFGDSENQFGTHDWYVENTKNANERYAHRVCQKKPNAWGLHDMHGNVHEWCSDWYWRELPGGRDPSGPMAGTFKVNRGGEWVAPAAACRSASRYGNSCDAASHGTGIRIACIQAPPAD